MKSRALYSKEYREKNKEKLSIYYNEYHIKNKEKRNKQLGFGIV